MPEHSHAKSMLSELPRFAATDLNERPITLPDESPAKLTLYIFAFEREQQAEVDSALQAIQPLFKAYSPQQFDYIEVPTIEDYGALFRWYVDNGMRSGITEDHKRARVVTLYTDMGAFKHTYGIENTQTITSMLVDRKGKIFWQHEGALGEKESAALQRTVAEKIEISTGNSSSSAL